MSLEENLLDKKISFSLKDIKWIITSGIFVILWVCTAYMWVQDRNDQATEISRIKSENVELKTKVTLLEGQYQGVSQATKIFMENSPGETRFRLELLEKRVDKITTTYAPEISKPILRRSR